MNDRFDDIEFAEFLQQKTGQHKMYPSDKLWRNIQTELHGRKKWPALTVIAFLVVTALTVSTVLYDHPAKTNFKSVPLTVSNISLTDEAKKVNTTSKSANIARVYKSKSNSAYFEPVFFNNQPLLNASSIASADFIAQTASTAVEPTSASTDLALTHFDHQNNTTSNHELYKVDKFEKKSIVGLPKVEMKSVNAKDLMVTSINKNLTLAKNLFDDGSKPDDFIGDLGFEKSAPILIKKKATRFQVQVYATPSISYRKLVDDKSRNNYEPISSPNGSTGPISPRYNIDVNDVVRHQPAMGTEVGVGVVYKLTNKLNLTFGAQFNIRKYFIDSYRGGLNVASIAVVRNNRLDTFSQVTSISANGGYAETQLDSKLYQVSVPIGLQWKALQIKNFGINLEGSIQPTLTLNKNVYLISTDYKYYADGTSFFRTWNINTSAQINFTYKTGNYNWFIGPQIRYQHLPTYTDKYPIKEHRLDYGLRVGFIKQLYK